MPPLSQSKHHPWPQAKLGEVLKKRACDVSVNAAESYQFAGVYCFGRGVFRGQEKLGNQFAYQRLTRLRSGDFVYPKLMAWEGAFGVVPKSCDGCVVSPEFPVFELDHDRISPQFLNFYFQIPRVWEEVSGGSTGTNVRRRRLHPDDFLNARIPLPPLAEQRRVVARMEELAAQIHEARTLRHQAAEEAEALAGSSASQLFQESKARRTIEDIADVRGGIQKGPHRAPGANPVRYLTVAHVHRNRILTDSPRYFEVSPSELDRWRLLRGDVLIIEGNGSADQIGRTALFRGEIENCVHQNHVIRIRPDQQRVLPEFLNSFLNSPAGQDAVQSQSRTSSGLRSLSVGRIKSISVPVPPLAEQRRIVAELDALQTEVDALKRLQAETAAELDALLPAILDKAFKEEL